MNNPQLLIDAIVQQTMVFIAQLATAGGIRAPLAGLANQVFADLTSELERQGVRKKVIADMFGMALRTYHRRSQELRLSRTDEGRTLWEAVYAFLREKGRVKASEVQHRFRYDDAEVTTGILNDLVGSGLVYRAGRGGSAVYKAAGEEDFASEDEDRAEANRYLVWLNVYRHGPVDVAAVVEQTHLSLNECQEALDELLADGKLRLREEGEGHFYTSDALDVPMGSSQGWEAAVLDHFQALTTAIAQKLSLGPSSQQAPDVVGGSTWSLDVWDSHPLAEEARGSLNRIRAEMEDLRERIDEHNKAHPSPSSNERVVVYLGQYLRVEDSSLNDQ